MNEQSENKVTKTETIDKSKQTSVAKAKDELNVEDLDKVAGGCCNGSHYNSVRKAGDTPVEY